MHFRSYRTLAVGLALVGTLALPAAASAKVIVPQSTTTTLYDPSGNVVGSSTSTPSIIYLNGDPPPDQPMTTTVYDRGGNVVSAGTSQPDVIQLGN